MNIDQLEFIGRRLRPVELALLTKWMLRLDRKEYMLPNNLKYYIDPISDFGLKLMKHNVYEEDMTTQITSLLKEGDIFVDLGANEGFFSILGATLVGQKGKVFSIEPQQRLWEVISKNVQINSLNNVIILPYGAGSSESTAEMHLYPTLNSGASSLSKDFNFKVSFRKFRKSAYTTTQISVKTLDFLLHNYKNIQLIKIDIEGFELEALNGAKEILSKRVVKHFLVEIHPEALASMNQSAVQIEELLLSYDYSKKSVAHNLLLFTLNENSQPAS